MFKVVLGPQPEKFLKKCDDALFERLSSELEKLAKNPFPTDVKRVVGKKGKAFRVRVGDYRIQYVVHQETEEILVFDLDKRPRAY